VPTELDAAALARIPSVLIGRGSADEWYTEVKCAADESRLCSAGVDVEIFRFEGRHEWTSEFSDVAGRFLARFV
jgi:predicted esterase